MKKVFSTIQFFSLWMDRLKNHKKILLALIALDIFMAIASNIADWDWLMGVPWYLMPFTPICSLYPLTLSIWFTLYYFGRKIPSWYTAFIFIGITSYGIMAFFYFPLYMTWAGVDWRNSGNMLWVATYALQSFIIVSEVKKLPIYQYVFIFCYFGFKDYADRYLGTFIDILQPGYPQYLIDFFSITIILLHLGAFSLVVLLPFFPRLNIQNPRYSQKKSAQKLVNSEN